MTRKAFDLIRPAAARTAASYLPRRIPGRTYPRAFLRRSLLDGTRSARPKMPMSISFLPPRLNLARR